MRSNVDEYFLGQQLGTDADGIPIYSPHLDRLSRPLNSKRIWKHFGHNKEKDKSWAQSLTLSANGDVFKLPAGTAKLAAVAEIGVKAFRLSQIRRLKMVSFIIRVLVENIVVLVHAKHLVQNYSAFSKALKFNLVRTLWPLCFVR